MSAHKKIETQFEARKILKELKDHHSPHSINVTEEGYCEMVVGYEDDFFITFEYQGQRHMIEVIAGDGDVSTNNYTFTPFTDIEKQEVFNGFQDVVFFAREILSKFEANSKKTENIAA